MKRDIKYLSIVLVPIVLFFILLSIYLHHDTDYVDYPYIFKLITIYFLATTAFNYCIICHYNIDNLEKTIQLKKFLSLFLRLFSFVTLIILISGEDYLTTNFLGRTLIVFIVPIITSIEIHEINFKLLLGTNKNS